jgi:tRNA 2-selenouridine synthase
MDISRFLEIRGQLPLVDVRSEGEYQQGHIGSSINIPILNNEERIIVGTTYKQHGQQEAIRAGFRLVGPRLADIIAIAEQLGNELIVHCWRGGMRSGNFCQFVGMAGIKTLQIKGGYKAYRRLALESFKAPYYLVVLAGLTGSGKSDVLRALKKLGEQVIDLEALASHKGSAFGGIGQGPQPTTEQFQNDFFDALMEFDRTKRIWIEDESIAVGKIFLPVDFWNTMNTSSIVTMTVPKAVRISRLVNEYGNVDQEAFAVALKGITRKLGGQHYNAAAESVAKNDMYNAIDLILNYYDKAYTNGIERKKDRIKLSMPWDGLNVNAFAVDLLEEVNRTSEVRSRSVY